MSDTNETDQRVEAKNLIDEIKEVIQVDDVYPQFTELTALSILSVAVGDKIYTENKYGVLYPQIMYLIVGLSGLTKKTVVLNKATELIKALQNRANKAVYGKYHFNDENDFKEFKEEIHDLKGDELKDAQKTIRRVERERVNYICPDQFTSEALITHLTRYPIGLMRADEFTIMLKGTEGKSYMSNAFEMLSKVYDGETPRVATEKRGEEGADRVNISMIAGTTPYFLYLLDEKFFLQGIGNRFLWMIELQKEKTQPDPDFLFKKLQSDELETKKQLLVEKLYQLSQREKEFIQFNTESAFAVFAEKVNKDNSAIEKMQEKYLDVEASYIVRMLQNELKISMLHYIGRVAVETDEPQEKEINFDDFNYAKQIVEKCYADYNAMYGIFKEVKQTTNVKSYGNEKDKILLTIKTLGGKCTISDIVRKLSWLASDVSKFVVELELDGRLTRKIEKAKNGREFQYIYLTEIDKDAKTENLEPFDLSKLGSAKAE